MNSRTTAILVVMGHGQDARATLAPLPNKRPPQGQANGEGPGFIRAEKRTSIIPALSEGRGCPGLPGRVRGWLTNRAGARDLPQGLKQGSADLIGRSAVCSRIPTQEPQTSKTRSALPTARSRGSVFSGPRNGSWEPLGQSGHETGKGRVPWETNGCILGDAGRPKWKFQVIYFVLGVSNDSTAI